MGSDGGTLVCPAKIVSQDRGSQYLDLRVDPRDLFVSSNSNVHRNNLVSPCTLAWLSG